MDNGADRDSRVRIFVMGENFWRDEDAWPLKRARSESFYLASKSADDRAGSLVRFVANSSYPDSTFLSDPATPLADPYSAYGAHDYRQLAGRGDTLVFDTEPLQANWEVTGPVRAEVYLSADCRDLDLWVRLLDVAPDGTAFNLMSPGLDVLRASYRNESRRPEYLKGGQTIRLNLNHLITGNVFQKGHRIRVQVSGSFFPNFSRNLQTGELETVSTKMQKATIRIYHDEEHASQLVLPIVSE